MEHSKLNKTFAHFLIDRGVITEADALDALDQQRTQTKPIGRLALESRYLSMKQVFHTLESQADSELRFGEMAIALGYLQEEQVGLLLDMQKSNRPGLCEVLFNMGLLTRSTLDQLRKEFLQSMENALT